MALPPRTLTARHSFMAQGVLVSDLEWLARSTSVSYQQPFPVLVATLLSPNANSRLSYGDSKLEPHLPTSSPIIELDTGSCQFMPAGFARVHPYLDEMGITFRVADLDQIYDHWRFRYLEHILQHFNIGPREFLRLPYRHCTECYSSSKKHRARFDRFPERLPTFSDAGLFTTLEARGLQVGTILTIDSDSVNTNPG